MEEDKSYKAFGDLMDVIFELADELNDKSDNEILLTDTELKFLNAMDVYCEAVVEEEEEN